jgi:hypothetical protein
VVRVLSNEAAHSPTKNKDAEENDRIQAFTLDELQNMRQIKSIRAIDAFS